MDRLTYKTEQNERAYCPPSVKCNGKCSECVHIDKMMNKLAEYEDAEEQGLLVKLPCAIGTVVYAVIRDCKGDPYKCHHTCDTCAWRYTHIREVEFDIEYISEVGNWIFLTKEEAEQALAKMKEV